MSDTFNVLIFGFALCFLVVGCSGTKSNDRSTVDSLNTDSAVLADVPIVDKFPINHNFPFGCGSFDEYKHQEVIGFGADEKHLNSSGIEKCLQRLNRIESRSLPTVAQKQFVRIGDYEDFTFDDSLLMVVDHFKYRLPDIGNYECYYTYVDTNYNYNWTKGNSNCYAVGNLVLVHKAFRSVKILNLYILTGRHDVGLQRMFNIDADKTIQIIQFTSTEDEAVVASKYRVKLGNGENISVTRETP